MSPPTVLGKFIDKEVLERELTAAFTAPSYSLVNGDGTTPKQPRVNYGTAGFRGLSDLLPPLAFRVMFVLFARGLSLRGGSSTASSEGGVNPLSIGNLGLCITASHNPSKDNGFKMIDGDGGMLNVSWEAPATSLANEGSVKGFMESLEVLVEANVDASGCGNGGADGDGLYERLIGSRGPVVVQVARDTRPSGTSIVGAVNAAAHILNKCCRIQSGSGSPLIRVVNHGVMTTPALHNLVFWHRWTGGTNPHFNAVSEKCFSEEDRAALKTCTFTTNNEDEKQQQQGLGIYTKSITSSYQELAKALPNLIKETTTKPTTSTPPSSSVLPTDKKHLVVDCSNGVGASVMKKLLLQPSSNLASDFTWHLIKDDTQDSSQLNEKCGADYVQKTQSPIPEFLSILVEIVSKVDIRTSGIFVDAIGIIAGGGGGKCDDNHCSLLRTELESALSRLVSFYAFDGDADRIVAFAPIFNNEKVFGDELSGLYSKSSSSSAIDPVSILKALLSTSSLLGFSLIDGNRLSVLFASLVQEMGVAAAVKGTTPPLTVGTVQTAYTNGASSLYAEQVLGLTVANAATGVKHLHPVAEHMGVGLYFEANGHGTMLLSSGLLDAVALSNSQATTSADSSSSSLLNALQWIRMLLSQSCGDAIAGLVASELTYSALAAGGKVPKWSAQTLLGLYNDLPSITDKVTVPDPSVIKNTADERRVVSPASLQVKIDSIVSSMKAKDTEGRASSYRSFVRPSGTEPIVRIYSEAPTVELNRELYDSVAKAVLEECK